MRVLVADDQAAVRSALRRLLKEEPGLVVVSEVVRTEELLDQAQATQPDLVLLDWELPGLSVKDLGESTSNSGNFLLDILHALHSHPKVVALSGRPEMRHAALTAGADDFVSKGDPPERLLAVLRAANACCGDDDNVAQTAAASAVDSSRDSDVRSRFHVGAEEET
jgi:DNA-binding NarL/FixJ family response regulator